MFDKGTCVCLSCSIIRCKQVEKSFGMLPSAILDGLSSYLLSPAKIHVPGHSASITVMYLEWGEIDRD